MPALSEPLRIAGAISLLACAMLSAHAQVSASPAGTREQPVLRQPTDAEIERATSEHRLPTEAELARVPIPSTPKLDGAVPSAPLDLEQLARQLHGARTGLERDANHAIPRLQIFVTLAMPKASLSALITQAARANAVVVLRGAKNTSLRQTLAAVHALIGTQPVAWQIDPPAFARYRITAAPAFVLTRANATPSTCGHDVCLTDHDFAKVTGDVTLEYALEAIARGAPAFAADAEGLLIQVRRQP